MAGKIDPAFQAAPILQDSYNPVAFQQNLQQEKFQAQKNKQEQQDKNTAEGLDKLMLNLKGWEDQAGFKELLGRQDNAMNGFMALSRKHQAFIDSLLSHNFNGTDAYCDVFGVDRRVGRASAARLLAKDSIKTEVQRRVSERSMGADEVLLKLTEQGRADISVFFKIIERGPHVFTLPPHMHTGTHATACKVRLQ